METECFPGLTPCEHLAPRYEAMPHGSIHHAKIVCAACGKYMGWQPKPETVVRRIETERKIAAVGSKLLSSWEKAFIESIKKLDGKLSPRQQATLDKIYDS